MGTVSALIDSARYDLVDYETGIVFDDAELLVYLNRMISLMDSTLASLNSTFVHGIEEYIDTTLSQNYVDISDMNRGNFDSIRSVWLDSDRLTGIPVDLMYYERKFRDGDVYPNYWSLDDDRILFETTCDRGYSTTVTPTNATEILTSSTAITYRGSAYATGDGPYWLSATTALPAELSEETDYYLIKSTTKVCQVATTAALAVAGTAVSFGDDGSGTITLRERTGLVIHYNVINRPRLSTWTSAFTATATDVCVVSSATTFVTGDGPFVVTTSGADQPAGLATSTNYWVRMLSPTTFKLATSKIKALEDDCVNITDAGTGTHTLTLTEYMPYNGRFDEFLREQLVMHAKAKREGQFGGSEQLYTSVFRKRAMEETLRREKYIKEYHMDW